MLEPCSTTKISLQSPALYIPTSIVKGSLKKMALYCNMLNPVAIERIERCYYISLNK